MIANDTLQTDLLAKVRVLKSLDQNVCHAEAFESALRDQTAVTDTLNIAIIQMSLYHKQKKNRTAWTNRGNIGTSTTATCNNNIAEQEPCQVYIGCGSQQHGTPRTNMGSNVQHLCET